MAQSVSTVLIPFKIQKLVKRRSKRGCVWRDWLLISECFLMYRTLSNSGVFQYSGQLCFGVGSAVLRRVCYSTSHIQTSQFWCLAQYGSLKEAVRHSSLDTIHVRTRLDQKTLLHPQYYFLDLLHQILWVTSLRDISLALSCLSGWKHRWGYSSRSEGN